MAVERLEQELAHAKADTERVAMSDLSARQRASREELAAFEAALKPMTELGQSLIKWAESWGHELQATLIDDLERLDAAMRPLNHGMRKDLPRRRVALWRYRRGNAAVVGRAGGSSRRPGVDAAPWAGPRQRPHGRRHGHSR